MDEKHYSADNMLSNADLNDRIRMRDALERAGVRRRLRCKRCDKDIPDHKRVDALYCTDKCQRAHRWEQITALRTEMRAEYRTITAPKECQCGVPLDNRPGRRGKVALVCQRCRWCINARDKRARKRAARGAEPLPPRKPYRRHVRADVLTHCLHGHEYAEVGYYVRKKDGGKICKQCLKQYEEDRRKARNDIG